MLSQSSAPKGYNIDKLLEFLGEEKTIYLLFFVGIDEKNNIKTILCSAFENELIKSIRFEKRWSSKNGRGEVQFSGDSIKKIIESNKQEIDIEYARKKLTEMININ